MTTERVEAARSLARAARLLERTCSDLHLSHYRVLLAVEAGDERASRVAERLVLGRPTISAAVDSLCQRGLLERGAVDGDLRAAELRLTEEGRSVLARVDAQLAEQVEALVARTPDPAATLHALAALGDALTAERVAR